MKRTIGLLISCTALLTACTAPPQPLPAPATPTPTPSSAAARSPDPVVKPVPPKLPAPPSAIPSPIPSGSPKVEFQPVDEAPPVDAQRPDAPENPDARTPAQRYNTQPLAPASPVPKKYGQPIGPATDCDRDGKADDTLVDYNGDGIPDECLKGDG